MTSSIEDISSSEQIQLLSDKWVLWAHLPHDTDWTLQSYIKIMEISNLLEAVILYKLLKTEIVQNCMLFLMRQNITPMWEDPKNRAGGSFSYKIINENVMTTWKQASFALLCDYISPKKLCLNINGITISPKKSFCIIKLWLYNYKIITQDDISEKSELKKKDCIIKKHKRS